MGTLVIGKKEFEISDETDEKIVKALDFVVDKLIPALTVGCAVAYLGILYGYSCGYKRGFAIGTLGGATLAYADVFDTIRKLKQ